MSIMSPDQKDIRGHPDHHSGYGDHRRLRCVWVFPPQPIHRVGQVHCVWDVSQQTEHCQETGQPTGDRAILLHGEWRFSKKRVLLDISKEGRLPGSLLLLLLKYIYLIWWILTSVYLHLEIPDLSCLIVYLFRATVQIPKTNFLVWTQRLFLDFDLWMQILICNWSVGRGTAL